MNETPLARAWRHTYPWLTTVVSVVLVILVAGLASGRARPHHDVPGKPPETTEVTAPGFGLPGTPASSPTPSASPGVTEHCSVPTDSLVVLALKAETSTSRVPDACAYLSVSQYETTWREDTQEVAAHAIGSTG